MPIITVEERNYLRSKCISINSEDYQPIYEIHSAGEFVSPEREIYSLDHSLKTQIWVWWTTHFVTLHLWVLKYRETVFILTLYGLLKLILGKQIKKIVSKTNLNNSNNSTNS